MLYSKLPGKTDRETQSAGNGFKGYKYLQRGGYVRSSSKGLYSLLPLGKRVEHRLKELIASELIALGGMEISVPLVSPEHIWQESGRLYNSQTPFAQFTDRSGRNMIISPTHEESVTTLMKELVQDHLDLPLFVYQFQLKFRDELRPRGGMIRSKEFLMKDGYSFHRSFVELNNFFPAIFSAYLRIFEQCAVSVLPAEADSEFMHGSRSYEFIMPHKRGKSKILQCDNCEYRASQSIAQGVKNSISEELRPLESVEVPHFTSLENLSKEWKLPISRFCISELFRCKDKLILVVHPADYHLSIIKLKKVLSQCEILPARHSDFTRIGQDARFLSPFGLPEDVTIIVDDSIQDSTNMISPFGESGLFYKNVNFGRDFDAHKIEDLVQVKEGQECNLCGGTLKELSGIELGHIFKLDDVYTKKMRFTYQNLHGERKYPHMGSYGIGIGRLMEAIAESNHDRRGLVWPPNLAPFRYFLMGTGKSPSIKAFVKDLGEKLGDQVLVDDRLKTIEEKYKDFDLLGIPLRIVVSTAYLEEGSVELMERKSRKKWTVPGESLLEHLQQWEQEL